MLVNTIDKPRRNRKDIGALVKEQLKNSSNGKGKTQIPCLHSKIRLRSCVHDAIPTV